MVVYLDVIVFYNALINLVVLYAAIYFNKIKAAHWIVIIATFISTMISVLLVMFLPTQLLNIVKFIIPATVCKVCTIHNTLKSYLKLLATYFLFYFVLSGITLGMKYSVSYSKLTIMALFCSICFFIFSYRTTIYCFTKNIKQRNNYTQITIVYNNTVMHLTGFNDSGNSLVRGSDNLPVFICDFETLTPILKKNEIIYEEIFCNTITGCQAIKTFKPSEIYVNEQRVNAAIGICNIPLDTEYDILINCDNINFKETEIKYV